jgi:hypothetical protein
MGYVRNDADTWANYSTATASRTVRDYTTSSLLPEFDPTKFKMRESRNSPLNPKATPIMLGLDCTGSMGMVVEAMRKALGGLMASIIERKPVSDPHVMALAVGDFTCDSAPIQATQFEADSTTVATQVEKLWLEGGGGGNDFEGYLGPLYMAAMRTDTDAIREGRKGYIFTVGDEEPQRVLRASEVKRFFGDSIQRDLTAEELVSLAARSGWQYYHLMVAEGSYMRGNAADVKREWSKLIGQHALLLTDHTRMAEVITSVLEVAGGKDKDAVAKSWSGKTSLVVRDAISGMTAGASSTRALKGPRTL